MRLETIILINRAPFENLRLDFDKENICVLSGINGVGKTTILSYIVDAFFELARKAYHNEFENRSNKYYRVSSGIYSIDKSKASIVYMRFRENDNVYYDYIDIRGTCNHNSYDQLISINGKIQFDSIKNALEKSGNTKYWSISDKKTITSVFDNNLLTFFPPYRYETPSYLNDPYRIELSFKTDMGFSGYLTNPIEVASDLPKIANWIMDVVLDMHIYGGESSELLNKLNDILTNILISKVNKKVRLGIGPRTSGLNRIAVMSKDERGVQIYPNIFSMSSGELALLCLFGELIKQSDSIQIPIEQVCGVVLVDEIDKHLHVKLQKEILPKLIKMFPNVQFIVSSHSPFLALGLQEESEVKYSLIDLDRGGLQQLPYQTEVFKEVYNIMITQNEQFAEKYQKLQAQLTQSTKPIIITEGKSDWKHLKAAMRELQIADLDVEFYEFEDSMGAGSLQAMLEQFAKIPQSRKIIGIFDRDDPNIVRSYDTGASNFIEIIPKSNVYAFLLPLVHEDIYQTPAISIEHYYRKEDLCKEDANGRRIFLGCEFHEKSGNSLDGQYQTRIRVCFQKHNPMNYARRIRIQAT